MKSQRLITTPCVQDEIESECSCCEPDCADIKTHNAEGGMSRQGLIGSKALVMTYADGELPTALFNEDSTKTELYIRIRVAIGDIAGTNLLLLSNGRMYLSYYGFDKVHYDEELRPKYLNNAVLDSQRELQRIREQLDRLSDRVSCSRHLVGYVEWCVSKTKDYSKIGACDLDLSFNDELSDWRYYSDAADEWIPLPKAWQKLELIVRTFEDRDQIKATQGTVCGILEDESIWIWNDEGWVQFAIPIDEVGDEYIVKYVVTEEGWLRSNGTVTLTPIGWVSTLGR